MRVGNKGLEPIRCHRNTNRESAYGNLGDNPVGRGVDHSKLIGVSRGEKRDWANAEDAKAKAKSIVIISVFMFVLLSLLKRSLLAHRMHTLWRWRCSKTASSPLCVRVRFDFVIT